MTATTAIEALAALDRSFPGIGRMEIAQLGRAGDPDGPTTVVAGHFEDDVIAAIQRTVEELGGTVIVDIDEGLVGMRDQST